MIKSWFEKANFSHELEIERGEPGLTIVSYTNRLEFDLVVIGSRGLNSLQEIHKIAKKVYCPVKIIK